jgi:hypothetical protein
LLAKDTEAMRSRTVNAMKDYTGQFQNRRGLNWYLASKV